MATVNALSTDATAAGDSATPPSAPSPSTSPSSKAASAGAWLVTWVPLAHSMPGSSASSHAARVSCITASPSAARSRSNAARSESCAANADTAAHAAEQATARERWRARGARDREGKLRGPRAASRLAWHAPLPSRLVLRSPPDGALRQRRGACQSAPWCVRRFGVGARAGAEGDAARRARTCPAGSPHTRHPATAAARSVAASPTPR